MFNETMSAIIPANYTGNGWGGVGHHSWGLMHGYFPILLMIAFVVFLVWLFRRGVHGNVPYSQGASGGALTTLSERFAKGEIDEQEFRTKRDVLKSKK